MVRAQSGSDQAGNVRRIAHAKLVVNCLSKVADESVSPAHTPKWKVNQKGSEGFFKSLRPFYLAGRFYG